MRGAAVSVVDEEREGGGVDDRVELEVHGEAVEDRRARRAPAQQQVQRAEDEQLSKISSKIAKFRLQIVENRLQFQSKIAPP